MYAPLVFFALVGLVYCAVLVRRARQRKADAAMIVTTWPEIELHQPYGGWNADAYDAGTSHDRSSYHAQAFLARGSGLGAPRRTR